ncbi:MAG: polysaccharide deacetylase family protein [Acidobacteriota bacterium]
MSRLLKEVGLAGCVALGRLVRRPGLAVLAYHSIDDSGSYMSTSPAMFRVQMEWLRDHGYRGISIRDLFQTERPAQNAVILTFDDGLANFAGAAWPVLAGLGFTGTAYVPTGFLDGEAAWYADYDLPRMACMSWEALRDVHRAGADIGSHAVTHRDLTALPEADLRDELRGSRAALEDGLGASVEHLAYPFGASDPRVERAAQEAGYRSAVILGRGRWRPWEVPFAIPRDSLDRIAIRHPRTARLSVEACVRGTFTWYAEAKARIRGPFTRPPHLRGA